MASNSRSSLLSLVLIASILVAITAQAAAGREVPADAKNEDKKQPQWFFEHDGSFLIPGIGRVYSPYLGHRQYIPGADDTFVPNPGFEVPNPNPIGDVPTAARP